MKVGSSITADHNTQRRGTQSQGGKTTTCTTHLRSRAIFTTFVQFHQSINLTQTLR